MEVNKGRTVRAATKMRKLAITMRRKTQSRAILIFSCRGKQRGTHAPLSPSGEVLGGSSFSCTNWSFIRFSSLIMPFPQCISKGLSASSLIGAGVRSPARALAHGIVCQLGENTEQNDAQKD